MGEVVKTIVKGWLVKLPFRADLPAGTAQKHGFLLPGLNDACRVDLLDTPNSLRLLHFQFFHGEQAVSFAFFWGDGGIDWESARKQVFGRYRIETKENESSSDARFMLCSGDENACAKEASRFIRGSETLAHEKGDGLDRGLHLLTEPRGFSCYSNEASTVNLMLSGAHDLNQFERFAMLFALGLAYREVLLNIIGQMGNALAELNQQDGDAAEAYTSLAKLRESVVLFDARYFFHAPVRPERQELFAVVQRFMCVLHVQPLHQEMADQLGEVSRLADHKLETMQQTHREAMLTHQQQSAVRHERKMGRLNITITLVALFLAAIDLLTHSPSEWMLAIKGWLALL